MASARIERRAAEGGGLPTVCIYCGEPAAQFVRHRFRWQPGWWLLSMPLIGLLLLGIGLALTAMHVPRVVRRALVLVIFVYLIPISAAEEFVVPVCSAHRYRLRWHEFFLWFLLLTLVGVAAIGLYAAVNQDLETSESILMGCVIGGPILLLVSIAIRFFTPRMAASEYGHIDMAMLSAEFVRSLAAPQASPHALVSRPVGRALPSGLAAVPRWVLVGGGGGAALLTLSILSCAGWFQFVKWYEHQKLDELAARNAEARERRQAPAFPPSRGAAPPPPAPAEPPPAAPAPATATDEREPPASPRREPAAAGGIGQGWRPTRAAPGYEMESTQEVQVNDLVHVWTGEAWRMGMAMEVAADQVRVRVLGGRPTPGEWHALDEVRHMHSADMRATLARSRRKPAADAVTPSTSPPPAAPPDPGPRAAGGSTPGKVPAENRGKLRMWMDASGKFQVEAELVKVEDEQAVLRKADGSIVRVPLSKLSVEDRLQAVAQSR